MRGGVQRTSSSQSTVSLGGCDMDVVGPVTQLDEEDDALWLRLEGGLFGSSCKENNGINEVSPSSSTGTGRNWFGARKSSCVSDASPPTLDADQFLWDTDSSSSTPTAVMLPNITPPHS